MQPGTIMGAFALAGAGVTTLFAYISNRDKNKNDNANVVIGGYGELYTDVRGELNDKIKELAELRARYEALQTRHDETISENKSLRELRERLEKRIDQLTEEIIVLKAQLGATNKDTS